jgi:hypothetical protein
MAGGAMAYECSTEGGVVRLLRMDRNWQIDFNGKRRGRWPSPDAAARAASLHKTGLPDWDRKQLYVSDNLLRWRPLWESL